MNLTNQQLLQVYSMYMNAQYLFHGKRYNIHELDYEHFRVTHYMNDESLGFVSSPIRECTLLLRSIDQLTEGEKRELAKVLGWEGGTLGYTANLDLGTIRIKDDEGDYMSDEYYFTSLPYPAADYLRRKRIALPVYIDGKMVDLFEEGVAKKINY